MSEENIKAKILRKHIEHLIDLHRSTAVRLDDYDKITGSDIVPFVMINSALIEIRNALDDIFELEEE